jgi:hypothetical protein
MSRIDQLIESYRTHIEMPLRPGLSAPQRVWFAMYPAADERRLVNRIEEFEILTKQAGHSWIRIDLKSKFAEWITSVDPEERAEWFKNPGDIDLYAKTEWKQVLTEFCTSEIARATVPAKTVFALTGLMELYDYLHVSDVLEGLEQDLPGYLLVFFPGEREGNMYRFLDARVGWNYLAVPILSER